MQVRVKLVEQDLKPLSWAIAFRKTSHRFIFLITFVLALLLLFMLPFMVTNATSGSYDVVFTILMIAMLVGVNGIPVYLLRRMLRSRQKIHGSQFEGILYAFEAEGVSWSSSLGSGFISYMSIQKVTEIQAGYIFFTSSVDYIYIPKRCMDCAETRETFEVLLREKVHKKALKLKSYPFHNFAPDTQVEPEQESLGALILEVEIQLQKGDFLQGYYREFFRGPMGIASVLGGSVVLLGDLCGYFIYGDLNVAALALAGVILILPSLSIWLNVRRIFHKNPEVTRTLRYSFYEEALLIDGSHSAIRFAYKDLVRFRKTPKVLILSPTHHHGIVIPRRVFAEREETLLRLEALMTKKIAEAKQSGIK